jgi:hypothetical protein
MVPEELHDLRVVSRTQPRCVPLAHAGSSQARGPTDDAAHRNECPANASRTVSGRRGSTPRVSGRARRTRPHARRGTCRPRSAPRTRAHLTRADSPRTARRSAARGAATGPITLDAIEHSSAKSSASAAVSGGVGPAKRPGCSNTRAPAARSAWVVHAKAALALQASLDQTDVLSSGERLLLSELLERIARG